MIPRLLVAVVPLLFAVAHGPLGPGRAVEEGK